MTSPVRVAVLGFGEAGAEFARDLVVAGADVRGFDPEVHAPHGVAQRADEADAVRDAELVFSLTTAEQAEAALRAGLPALAAGTLWAEANTCAPALKARLAEQAARVDAELVDVAIMAPVPGTGLHTPMSVSGPGAPRFAELMRGFGVTVTVVAGPVGAASSRKLLRSVVYKGLAAAVVEGLAGAEAAGCADWFRSHIAAELRGFDEQTLDRLIDGTYLHAARRAEEMAAAAAQLTDLGVTPHSATATRDALRAIANGPGPDSTRPSGEKR
ncbi:DUF1932 domain-containing protein [Nocardia sp. CDC186]|uniref:DUF1932 domain-containing protein n=1 Tax=Nocardia implantans TaxID=3108168 RepID=A0ABU6AY22_9NOCA|nr:MULTISPECIES: DUF1932 domain-containing protein [unclassified Nocardia]MBF6193666.1 NAD(P)-dependent oxidoreductase [Nocardia beijingensis]MEA3529596.1 DUF1932 domain-containing protein [Nocardia sp. CDC192]MEB3512182.1 DUF1932 domain-containing protein [Nocardia sp. CDC186]